MEESEEEKRPDDGAHTETNGLFRDILEGEVRKKRGRPKLKYFDQIIGDIGCETFREVKQLARDRAEWRRLVASNHS